MVSESLDGNSNYKRKDVTIGITKTSEGRKLRDSSSSIQITLKQSTAGVGIFEGTLELTPDKTEYAGDLEVIPGEILSLTYRDVNKQVQVSKQVEITAFDPDMRVDKDSYSVGDQVTVTIVQPNENIDPDIIDRFKVRITSESDTEGFDLWMIETSEDTGVFCGTFHLSKTTFSRAIKVFPNDDVFIEYNCAFPADYADRKQTVKDPSKDFTLVVPVGSMQDAILRNESLLMTLQSYADPQLVERIKNDDYRALWPRNKTITIVFWDIRGFSRMCEVLRGKEGTIVTFLADYFNLAQKVVAKHGGMVDKFVGDGVMALFGVFNRNTRKEHYDEDAANAVEAALEFRDEFKRMIDEWSDRWAGIVPRKIDISLRCGINTDEVIVGNIGNDGRSQFTAIGSAVNIASRLEKEAKDMQILVTSLTLKKISNRFESRKAKVIKSMKNIDGTFECFEVTGRV